MNEIIKPMLCEGAPVPKTNDPSKIWEIKRDGIRILPHVERNSHYLQARSGSNKTETFPELRPETRLPAILDGEAVSATGLSFQDSIQRRMNRIKDIPFFVKAYPAKLIVFDILELNGRNVEHLPLLERKGLLADVLVEADNIELGSFTEDALDLWNNVVIPQGLEGIVGKDKAGRYVRNARNWLKVKAWKRNYGKDSTGETFLVIGYTQGTGWRKSTFGALEIARLEANGTSTYVGEVGTGFDREEIRYLSSLFILGVCPWSKEPERAFWVKPFAIRMQYLEYSNEGMMRFPSFKGVI